MAGCFPGHQLSAISTGRVAVDRARSVQLGLDRRPEGDLPPVPRSRLEHERHSQSSRAPDPNRRLQLASAVARHGAGRHAPHQLPRRRPAFPWLRHDNDRRSVRFRPLSWSVDAGVCGASHNHHRRSATRLSASLPPHPGRVPGPEVTGVLHRWRRADPRLGVARDPRDRCAPRARSQRLPSRVRTGREQPGGHDDRCEQAVESAVSRSGPTRA